VGADCFRRMWDLTMARVPPVRLSRCSRVDVLALCDTTYCFFLWLGLADLSSYRPSYGRDASKLEGVSWLGVGVAWPEGLGILREGLLENPSMVLVLLVDL